MDKEPKKSKKSKHIFVDADTHQKVKVLAAMRGQTVKDLVKELIEEGLKK